MVCQATLNNESGNPLVYYLCIYRFFGTFFDRLYNIYIYVKEYTLSITFSVSYQNVFCVSLSGLQGLQKQNFGTCHGVHTFFLCVLMLHPTCVKSLAVCVHISLVEQKIQTK